MITKNISQNVDCPALTDFYQNDFPNNYENGFIDKNYSDSVVSTDLNINFDDPVVEYDLDFVVNSDSTLSVMELNE